MYRIPFFSLLLFFITISQCAFAQRDLFKIPDPDPKIEQDSFIVAEGFEVNLFAADPLLAKPIQMNFDHQGRLWIASSEVYPQIKPGQKPTDKIIIVEDTNNDGKADKRTVFADGLLIPTGVLPGDGGCYVANSTQLIHLSDTDGDGKADRNRIILTGFGTEDTHHLLHTLRWGHDGRINMNQSIYIHSHIETPQGVKHLNGGGIWQFRPESMQLEVLCRGFVNPWGHHFDRWGQSFATDGAYGEGINYVFPGSVFVTAPGAKRLVKGLNPGSPKHCSLEILSGSHLPEDWQGNMITNDFRANRVCRFVVSEDGSGYASRQEVEVIKSHHVAFRPIDVKMGPDGAIYIADWYNPIIQHGEVDFRDERRDHVHGRIWRVTAKGRPLVKRVNIPTLTTEELFQKLSVKEEWLRLQAKLELKSRGKLEILPKLEVWLNRLEADDPDLEHKHLEALWIYQCLNEISEPLLKSVLTAKDHRARAAAVRIASQWKAQLPDSFKMFSAAISDEHPRVRLEAVCALREVPTIEAAQLAVRILDQPMDRFLDFALWQCLRDLKPVWLPAVKSGDMDFGGNATHLTFAFKAAESGDIVAPLLKLVRANKIAPEKLDGVLGLIAAVGKPAHLSELFQMAIDTKTPAAQRATLFNAMAESVGNKAARPAANLNRLVSVLGEENGEVVAAAARTAGIWQLASAEEKLLELAVGDRESLVRVASIQALGNLKGPRVVNQLERLAASDSIEIQSAAFAALAKQNLAQAVKAAVGLLENSRAEFDPTGMVNAIVARKGAPQKLAAKLKDKTIPTDVARRAIRAVRSSSQPSEELIAQLSVCGKIESAGWKLNKELLLELVKASTESGDPVKGQFIYRRNELQCMKCHAIAGAGGRVGPDMVSIGASAPVDYLVESLLDPNAKIKENFHSKTIETIQGKVVSGIVLSSDDQQTRLRLADGTIMSFKNDDIEDQYDGRSLMPDGTVDLLTKRELVDLVAFLSQLGKIGDFAVGNERVARNWESLVWTNEGHRRLNRTSFDTAATNDPALTWEPQFSLVSGGLPIQDLAKFVIHRGSSPTVFVRTRVTVSTAGAIGLQFSDDQGIDLWIDEKPVPVKSRLVVEVAKGEHQLTIAANLDKRRKPIRLQLIDVDGSKSQAQWKTD